MVDPQPGICTTFLPGFGGARCRAVGRLPLQRACHRGPNGISFGQMTAAGALFVRIRNAEGKYLGGEETSMSFFDDIGKAIVFDCRRDDIEGQLEYLFLTQGVLLEVVPVDPREIHETCDRCGRLVLSFQAFFDGKQSCCAACRKCRPTA